MKWLVIVLVFIPIVCGNKRFEYRNVNADSCDVDDAECVTNQGIEGRCRSTCQVTERVVESDKLCPHSDCKCCTTNTDKCDEIYPGSYCGPPPCDVNMLQIFDTVLCNHNYVCCRPKLPEVAHHQLREDKGVKGMKAHYHTFDGVRYSFKGICTYLLMKENVTDPRFHVWANHASVTENGRTSVMVKSVDVDVNGVAIELQQGNGKLMVNGADIRPELENNGHYEIDGIEFSFVKNQNRIRVSVTGTFQVDWNGKGHIIIELDKSMIGNEKEGGKVIGLLGNANGVREDELIEQLYDGTYRVMSKLEAGEKPTMEEMIRFGISWIKDCQEVV